MWISEPDVRLHIWMFVVVLGVDLMYKICDGLVMLNDSGYVWSGGKRQRRYVLCVGVKR
jgi:hypothetical protein